MKRFLYLFAILSAFLTSCTSKSVNSQPIKEPPQTYIQEFEQLHLDTSVSDNKPLIFSEVKAVWIPVMEYETLMLNKNESEFRNAVNSRFSKLKGQGFNTLFVHLRAYGDAYYNSELFPKGTFFTGDYDVLQIMLDEAHKLGLSLHGWINPLRCQTEEEMKKLPDNFTLKKWYSEKKGTLLCVVDGRCYLNPAYEEVIRLITDGVSEILNNYDVDGIHIDDYFYPTVSPDFDSSAFAESGSADLSGWRLENCTKLVKSLYDCVKTKSRDLIFSISPQGNINSDYEKLFADVRLWGSCKGYCDMLIPQIYYGFENESCPFSDVLAQWESLVTSPDVSLVVGLAGYKVGKIDKWAGSGENEWLEHDDIIERQIEAVENSSAAGCAIYS